MTYASILSTAAIACDHHACACAIERYTDRSAERGRNRRMLYDASCTPSAVLTANRNRPRSLRESVERCAWVKANSRINAAEGSGNSGTDWDSGTPQRGRPILNKTHNEDGQWKVLP